MQVYKKTIFKNKSLQYYYNDKMYEKEITLKWHLSDIVAKYFY